MHDKIAALRELWNAFVKDQLEFDRATFCVAAVCLAPGLLMIGSAAPIIVSITLYICLWVLSVWDWRTLRLPNLLTAAFFLAGLLYIYMAAQAHYVQHLIGALVGLLFFPVLNLVYRSLRGRDGVGMGDAKLLAGIGLWLGWTKLPAVLLIASMAGLIYAFSAMLLKDDKNAASKFPFGPFLSLGCWMVWLYF